jgi:hypothetical protein
LRNATQAEINALYAVPGFQAAISEVQTNGRSYNTVVAVLQAGGRLSEVKELLMQFMRDNNMKAGNTIPQKPLMKWAEQTYPPGQRPASVMGNIDTARAVIEKTRLEKILKR